MWKCKRLLGVISYLVIIKYVFHWKQWSKKGVISLDYKTMFKITIVVPQTCRKIIVILLYVFYTIFHDNTVKHLTAHRCCKRLKKVWQIVWHPRYQTAVLQVLGQVQHHPFYRPCDSPDRTVVHLGANYDMDNDMNVYQTKIDPVMWRIIWIG